MKILVGYNGSEVANAALSQAKSFAKTYNAKVFVVASLEGGSGEKMEEIGEATRHLKFAKDFMDRHGIPTAAYGNFTEIDEAIAFIHEHGAPIVVKADGLAAGKGVVIPTDQEELETALDTFFEQRAFGDAGDRILVEEFLEGTEVSFMAVCDGTKAIPLATARDYKQIGEGGSRASASFGLE